jgi:predicted nucleic acid-binding protein
MSAPRRVVMDASVGVKWFREEPGSAAALELLRSHGVGDVELVVPSLFVYEVVAVATRTLSAEDARTFWERFLAWRIGVVEVSDALVSEALGVREQLGCNFYDALAPALAAHLDAQLCSADSRAHGEWPGVRLVQ